MSTTTSSSSGDDLQPQTGPLEHVPPQETPQNVVGKLILLLCAAFLLRLFIIRFPYMFTLDVNTFRSWTDTIIKVGPTKFYTSTWSDYPPLFMYFLWVWGLIQMPFTHSSLMSIEWAKLPACIADVINGYLIFHLLKGRVAIRSAFRTAAFYVFNPVVIFVSAVWGQVDSIITMMMLLISLMVILNWLIPAAVLSAAAILVKPQGLFMTPLVFFATWFKNPPWKWPLAIAAGVATIWLGVLPATWDKLWGSPTALFGQPFFWLQAQMKSTGDNYPYSTVNAFNIWMLPPPNETWKSDGRTLFFLPHHTWGMILIIIALGLVAWYLWRNRATVSAFPYYLAGSVTLTSFYMLPTRMHERYIFPAIAFLALAAAFNRRMNWVYWGWSITSFLSIAYIFFFYNETAAWVEGVKNFMNNGPLLGNLKLSGMVVLSLVNIWLYGELLSFMFVKTDPVAEIAENRWVRTFRTLKAEIVSQAVGAIDYAIAIAIACAFFIVGVIRLGMPNEQIFDEVYHARTAMEYIAGVNPYEWTHPPVAKLLAAGSILLFHGQFDLASKVWTEQQAFAWRFSSLVFGALTLLVMYALTRSLFNNRQIATAATAFLALDGVFFVQSRVAMTNIYEVCFILLGTLGLWLYIKTDRTRWLFLMGFGLALGLATRWSTLYAWGLTGLLLLWHFWSVKRVQWNGVADPGALTWQAKLKSGFANLNKAALAKWVGLLVVCMALIPLVVYALSYIPFVLQGPGDWQMKLFGWNTNDHGWGKVIFQQKDMWEYHAHLNATHPYSSPWWSWPLMLRPTWYYFHDFKNGTLGGVWAIGNAFIWWLSIPALAYAGFLAWRDKLKSLGLITVLGFGLWLMWGVQPRPLLYMHYMFETIPFACMAIAYTCYQLWYGRPDFSNVVAVPGETPQAMAKASTPPLTPKAQRILAGVVAGLIVAWFIFYYPLLADVPISWQYYNWHLWYNRAWI